MSVSRTVMERWGMSGDGWRDTSRQRRIVVALLVLLAIAFGVAGVLVITMASQVLIGIALIFFAGALLLASFHATGLARSRGGREPVLVELDSERGLYLPVRAWTWLGAMAFLGWGLVSLAGAIAMVVLAVMWDESPGLWLALVLGLVGVLCIVVSDVALKSRKASMGVVMTPDSVVWQFTGNSRTLPWGSVARVTAFWTRQTGIGRARLTVNRLGVETTRGTRNARPIDIRVLAVKPEAARDLLDFYLAHPEARAELADSRSVARFGSFHQS